MSDLKYKGGCLCGAVKIEVTLESEDVHICHCDMCRKWAGSSSFSLGCDKDWVIEGEENLTWYDSSEIAQRSFCNKCGTHLMFRTKDGNYQGVPAGALEGEKNFKLDKHIFIDKKPDYYDFADSIPRLTEKEFFEMVGAAE